MDTQKLQQELHSAFRSLDAVRERQQALEQELLTLQTFHRIQDEATQSLFRQETFYQPQGPLQTQRAILQERFRHPSYNTQTTTAWVDTANHWVTVLPIQIAPATVEQLHMQILMAYDQRNEQGEPDDILEHRPYYVEIEHDPEDRLLCVLKGTAQEDCNYLRLSFDALGPVSLVCTWEDDDVYRVDWSEGTQAVFHFPQAKQGAFELSILKDRPDRKGEQTVFSSLLFRELTLGWVQWRREALYQTRPLSLPAGTESLTVALHGEDLQNVQLEGRVIDRNQPDTGSFTKIYPDQTWQFRPRQRRHHVIDGHSPSFGETHGTILGVAQYRIFQIPYDFEPESLDIKMGVDQWCRHRLFFTDEEAFEAPLTPKYFQPAEAVHGGYHGTELFNEFTMEPLEWNRWSGFLYADEARDVTWTITSAGSDGSWFLNGLPMSVIESQVQGRLRQGWNRLEAFVRSRDGNEISMGVSVDAFTMHAYATALQRVSLYDLQHKIPQDNPYTYAVDEDGWVLTNYDPTPLGAQYSVQYILQNAVADATHSAVELRVRMWSSDLRPPRLQGLDVYRNISSGGEHG